MKNIFEEKADGSKPVNDLTPLQLTADVGVGTLHILAVY